MRRSAPRGPHPRRERGIDHLLPRRVTELRDELGLAAPRPRARVRDVFGILGTIAFAPLLALVSLVVAKRA